jgi:TonB family protein
MAVTYPLRKPEYRAFAVSLALHALLLLLIFIVAGKTIPAPLEVSIVVEREQIEPEQLGEQEETLRPQPKKSRRKLRTAREKSQAKSGQEARRDNRTLQDPWSSYEQRMFAQNRTSSGTNKGSTTSQSTSWGSEKTGRTEKRGENEQVNVPPGRSDSATRWRKGAARRLISLPPIEYPESIRRKSGQGSVELLIEVDERGHVESVEILKSSGITRLDLNARNAYRRAVFSPSASGESATGVVTVTFRMKDN